MASALIALGSNLGDRSGTLAAAVERLAAQQGIEEVQAGRWHRTAPVGGPGGQQPFLNGTVRCRTSLPPEELHQLLHRIETELGRRRRIRWDARAIDLDLLLYDDLVLESADLVLPHPRMGFRRFVLEPAVEIAANWADPHTGHTLAELLARLNRLPRYVALAGGTGEGNTQLAQAAARRTGGRAVSVPADPPRADAPRDDRAAIDVDFELELLSRRAAALESAAAERPETLISDFWLEQSAALAPDSGDFNRIDEALRGLSGRVPPPTLLVWLETEPATADSPGDRGAALQARIRRRADCPVLRFSAADRDNAETEVAAAIEAMR